MTNLFNNVDLSTIINGLFATVGCIVVLFTLFRACRFVRRPQLQDMWATIFQDVFHITLFSSVLMMAIDHLSEMAGANNLMTDYMSPPLSDFFITLAACSWSAYKLRKNWFQRQGLDLSEDLRVVVKGSDETVIRH